MKFTKIMILLLGIFFIGFPQGANAKKKHVSGKPFAHFQEQIENLKLTLEQQGATGPAEPQRTTGILEKYMKVNEVIPYETGCSFIVYCNNIPDDVAISGNAYTYWTDTPGGFQYSSYKDILRPVCTYYGEGNPGPAPNAMTCQPGELPIGWQFIQHPANNKDTAHVVLNVMCIYAPETQ